MKVQRNELVEALEIVKPGLANKELIEQSTSFAFIENEVVTYNDYISVSHPISLKIRGTVPAVEFYSLLKKMKSKEVEIIQKENEILIKSKNAKAGIIIQEDVKLPLDEVKAEYKWKELPPSFMEGLNTCKGVCSSDLANPVLTGIHCRPDGIQEASDNFSIIQYYGEKVRLRSFIIEATMVPHIRSIEPTHAARTRGWIHFKNENKTMLHCRVLEDDFPDLAVHLDAKIIKEVEFPKGMLEALEKAHVFAKRDKLGDEEILIRLVNDSLTIKGQSEIGWYEETTKLNYKGTDIEFTITPNLLENVLKRNEKLHLCKDRVMIKASDYTYLALLQTDISL